MRWGAGHEAPWAFCEPCGEHLLLNNCCLILIQQAYLCFPTPRPRRRLQSRAALAGLVDAAERALPQAKRAALQRKCRERGVALSRRQRRFGAAGAGASRPGRHSGGILTCVEANGRHR